MEVQFAFRRAGSADRRQALIVAHDEGLCSMAIDRNKPILKTEALCRSYGQHVALSDLNLTVHEGEVFGYIGPNGAGKTTTFRILCGLMNPTSGKALIAGQDVTGNKDQIKRLVGYLPDNFGVYPTLHVWEYLDFFASAY